MLRSTRVAAGGGKSFALQNASDRVLRSLVVSPQHQRRNEEFVNRERPLPRTALRQGVPRSDAEMAAPGVPWLDLRQGGQRSLLLLAERKHGPATAWHEKDSPNERRELLGLLVTYVEECLKSTRKCERRNHRMRKACAARQQHYAMWIRTVAQDPASFENWDAEERPWFEGMEKYEARRAQSQATTKEMQGGAAGRADDRAETSPTTTVSASPSSSSGVDKEAANERDRSGRQPLRRPSDVLPFLRQRAQERPDTLSDELRSYAEDRGWEVGDGVNEDHEAMQRRAAADALTSRERTAGDTAAAEDGIWEGADSWDPDAVERAAAEAMVGGSGTQSARRIRSQRDDAAHHAHDDGRAPRQQGRDAAKQHQAPQPTTRPPTKPKKKAAAGRGGLFVRSLKQHFTSTRLDFDAEGAYFRVDPNGTKPRMAPRDAISAGDVVKIDWKTVRASRRAPTAEKRQRAMERIRRLTRGEDPATVPPLL